VTIQNTVNLLLAAPSAAPALSYKAPVVTGVSSAQCDQDGPLAIKNCLRSGNTKLMASDVYACMCIRVLCESSKPEEVETGATCDASIIDCEISHSVLTGITVTFTGTNFGASTSAATVFVGAIRCTIDSQNHTHIIWYVSRS